MGDAARSGLFHRWVKKIGGVVLSVNVGSGFSVGRLTNLLERAPLRERELVASPTLSLLGVLPATGSTSSSRGPARLLLLDGLVWSPAVPPSMAPRRRRPFSYMEMGA